MAEQPDQVEITLASGATLTVLGSIEEVEKALSDAARSGQSRLAWFSEGGTATSVGINPAEVAIVRPGRGRA